MLFLAVKVISKDIALEYIIGSSGHGILANESYITGVYLEKDKEMKDKFKYTLVNTNHVYIHLSEIFATNIQRSGDLCMSKEEYHSLCAELFYVFHFCLEQHLLIICHSPDVK